MKKLLMLFAFAAAFSAWAVDTSEIRVDLKLDATNYLLGEKVRAVVDIANSSAETLQVAPGSSDRFFIEVCRQHDMYSMTRLNNRKFIADFTLKSGEGQKFEVLLDDHFGFQREFRYLARPVLVHNGTRYEGLYRAFDMVSGVFITKATQIFSADSQSRDFELYYWTRAGQEHLFLRAKDQSGKTWMTRDLGPMIRITPPTISILPSGEVIILHRLNPDQFVRTEFWSLPKKLVFRERVAVQDPDTAGTNRVRELYKDKGVEAKKNPWYKFW